MEWLFRPKVQLGLFVNLVFVLFTIISSSADMRATRQRYTLSYGGATGGGAIEAPPAAKMIPYVPLPPPSGPSHAATVTTSGLLTVYLDNDLTLVRRPGRTLALSPSFSIRAQQPDSLPRSVDLRFIIFSTGEACPAACMMVIDADGSHVWESAAGGTFSTGWTHDKIPGSKTRLESGEVVETLSAETLSTQIPYNIFIKTISARRVVISLGPDKVELTADQIEALRDMHRQLPSQIPPAPPAPPERESRPRIIKAF